MHRIRTWENVTHVFVEESVKDQAKEAFGYSAVPFYAVFDKVGSAFKPASYCRNVSATAVALLASRWFTYFT